MAIKTIVVLLVGLALTSVRLSEAQQAGKVYEVQIDIDQNSHKATKVDVTTNAWKADATEKALKQTQARR